MQDIIYKTAQPFSAFPAEKYFGFQPGTTLLPAGHIRFVEQGSRPLPYDLTWHRDVAVKVRTGHTLWTDIFLPGDFKPTEPIPALVNWSPYGKTGNGT
jgi:predicted acyl esterase